MDFNKLRYFARAQGMHTSHIRHLLRVAESEASGSQIHVTASVGTGFVHSGLAPSHGCRHG